MYIDNDKMYDEINKKELDAMISFQLEIDNFKGSLTIKDSIQQSIIESNELKYFVNGPAGSGKTILAMIKMLELESTNKSYQMIIYTKALKSYLIGLMEKARFDNIEAKILHLDDPKFKDIFNPDIEYILIDETQDLDIKYIDKFFNNFNRIGFFLYGDENQNIYPRKTKNKNIFKEVESKNCGISGYRLNKIYRFSNTIYDFANSINPNKSDIINRSEEDNKILVSSEIPKIIEFQDLDSELSYIVEILKANSWNSVAILLKDNPTVEKVYKWFIERKIYIGKRKISFEAKYYYDWDKETKKYKNEHYDLDFSTNNIKILTYHSSKGLEFDRVFIPLCNTYEKPNKTKYGYNNREALYVALTRAKITLIVSYNNHYSKSRYLDEICDSTFKFERR